MRLDTAVRATKNELDDFIKGISQTKSWPVNIFFLTQEEPFELDGISGVGWHQDETRVEIIAYSKNYGEDVFISNNATRRDDAEYNNKTLNVHIFGSVENNSIG